MLYLLLIAYGTCRTMCAPYCPSSKPPLVRGRRRSSPSKTRVCIENLQVTPSALKSPSSMRTARRETKLTSNMITTRKLIQIRRALRTRLRNLPDLLLRQPILAHLSLPPLMLLARLPLVHGDLAHEAVPGFAQPAREDVAVVAAGGDEGAPAAVGFGARAEFGVGVSRRFGGCVEPAGCFVAWLAYDLRGHEGVVPTCHMSLWWPGS